jgi:hypothetical protein
MVQNNISFPNTRKRYSAKVKFQAVLEMIRGEKTTGNETG